LLGSGELRPQRCDTDEVDGSDHVVGQDAERCFPSLTFLSLERSRE
jgi:hypothetical protein